MSNTDGVIPHHRHVEQRLWDSAGQFRADSGIKAQESFGPIRDILFLGLAEARLPAQLEKAGARPGLARRSHAEF